MDVALGQFPKDQPWIFSTTLLMKKVAKANAFEASWSSGDLGGLSLSHFNLRGQ